MITVKLPLAQLLYIMAVLETRAETWRARSPAPAASAKEAWKALYEALDEDFCVSGIDMPQELKQQYEAWFG